MQRLANGTNRCTDGWFAASHGLHQALRHAFIAKRWQYKQIKTVQPLRYIVLVADHDDAIFEPVQCTSAFDITPAWAITDDQDLPIGKFFFEAGEGINQIIVAFPITQSGQYADGGFIGHIKLGAHGRLHVFGDACFEAHGGFSSKSRQKRESRKS